MALINRPKKCPLCGTSMTWNVSTGWNCTNAACIKL